MEIQFHPVAEFAALFSKEIPRELPRLRAIYHKVNIVTRSSWIPTYQPSGDRFKKGIIDKINGEEIYGTVYRAEEDTNAVVMFSQLKSDGPKEPRFILDCRPRNAVTFRNHTSLPIIEEEIAFVSARPLWSKIDLTNGHHNIRIDPDSEKHTTFLCHMGHYRSRIMQ